MVPYAPHAHRYSDPMPLTVLLFGPHAAAAGAPSLAITPPQQPSAPTCGQVLEAIPKHAPALAPLMAGARLAVNHRFAQPHQPIHPGDELALIGLVSGG